MRQLSRQDTVFFYTDNARANSNVSLVHIYDQSTAPGGKVRFKSILSHIENRLERLPVLRQRVLATPFELDRPYWVDDEDFNLEYHVRHIALPKPGDWRQFCIQISRIHARALDMRRPLWEMYVIEGLDSFLDLPEGSFAVLFKIHHAAINLDRGYEVTTLLHDLSPIPERTDPQEPWFPRSPPSDLALMARTLGHSLLAPIRSLRPIFEVFATVAPAIVERFADVLRHPDHAVVTRFNSVVSPHRVFDTRRFPMEEFDEVRTLIKGASIDDVVFAMCGGTLRRYLEAQGELPEGGLTATTPLAFDMAGDGVAEFSWKRVHLGSDIEDPLARLRMIREQTAAWKKGSGRPDAYDLSDVARYSPAPTIAMASKVLSYASAQLGRWAPLANCAIVRVPGPRAPLYLQGARLTYYSAIMPISDGMGLVFAVTTYDGKIIVSFTSCYELLPDPEFFAQCLRDVFQDYLALARTKPKGKVRRRLRSSIRGKMRAPREGLAPDEL